jgi:hypothetical protein
MQNAEDIVERYLAVFNESDASQRSTLLESLFASDGTYTDPHVDLCGPSEIGDFVAQSQGHFPGFTFRLAGAVDAHHDQARFQWQAGPVEEPDRYVGFDVIVADHDGLIQGVYGFMDAAPAA